MRIAIKRKCRTSTKSWSIKDFRSLLKVPISISADIFVCYFCVIYSCYLYSFVNLCVMFSFSTRIFYRGYPGLQLIVLVVFAIVD